MDLFQHHYYRLIKILLMLLGQWPNQSPGARSRILVLILVIAISGFIPQVLAFVKYRNDWKIILDCLLPCLFATVCTLRFANLVFNSQKIWKLLDRILINWQLWARDREVNIFHKYAEHGEKITIIYTSVIFSTVIMYMTQPIIPKIIDVILTNGTKQGKFPYPVDYYYFDAHKYYSYVMVHFYVCACVATMPLIASDSILIICVQHVCSVFAALGHKLEQIGNNGTSVESIVHLSLLIDRHNDAIEYANLIEATYTWNFFVGIGLGTLLINLLGIQIIMGTNDPESVVRFVAFALSLEVVFYVDYYISQILMDHSIGIDYYVYNSQWYRIPPKSQKLVQLITIRCRTPCQLTAGKILIMSMRNFGLTLRTSMSYFAVFRNMNDELNAA